MLVYGDSPGIEPECFASLKGCDSDGISEHRNNRRSGMRTRMPGNRFGAPRNDDDYMLDQDT